MIRSIKVTTDRDDPDVPHSVCRDCHGYVPRAEMEQGRCADCATVKGRINKRKTKGYKECQEKN